jgi:hypothetical protein
LNPLIRWTTKNLSGGKDYESGLRKGDVNLREDDCAMARERLCKGVNLKLEDGGSIDAIDEELEGSAPMDKPQFASGFMNRRSAEQSGRHPPG